MGSPQAVAAAGEPYLGEKPVAQGIRAITDKFRALDTEDPTWVAIFLGGGDEGTRELIQSPQLPNRPDNDEG